VVACAVIPPLGKLRQEDHEFKGSLSYIKRLCLKRGNTKNTRKTEEIYIGQMWNIPKL
jgi:hypothetical protein